MRRAPSVVIVVLLGLALGAGAAQARTTTKGPVGWDVYRRLDLLPQRVFVDGASEPQIHGTGTEDFYEGGWYFLLRPFTLPQNGLPAFQRATGGCTKPSCATTYRLMLGDSVPFRSSLRFGIEHGPANDVDATYGSTAYWYAPSG